MLEKEIHLDENASYSSTTDEKGIICSVSDDFVAISGYSKEELIGQNHNIVRHPDMPKVIFKILWEKLEKNEQFVGFIKNRTKSGDYYWMVNKIYLFRRDEGGKCKYFSYKGGVSARAKVIIGEWYEKLLKEEEKGGIEASEQFMKEYLDFRGVTFDEYMETLLDAKGLLKVGYFMARKLFK